MEPLKIIDTEYYLNQLISDKKKYAHFQSWIVENEPANDMSYKPFAYDQISFIKKIFKLFEDKGISLNVISTHTSKSIKLPVCEMLIGDEISIIIRDNFLDWKVSINSNISFNNLPISLFFKNGEEQILSCYCEGFKDEWIYLPYSRNKKRFTVELRTDYHMWTLMFLINEILKQNENNTTNKN